MKKMLGKNSVHRINRLILCSLVISLLLGMGTIGLSQKVNDLSYQKDMRSKAYETYYAMIVSDTEDPFWRDVYAAAKEEGEKHNVYVELLGEGLIEQYTIKDKFMIALASKVDGILIAPEGEQIESLLEQAQKANIPVVNLLDDSTKANRLSFIGINSRAVTELYVKELRKMMPEVNKVMILVDAKTEQSRKNRLYINLEHYIKEQGLMVDIKQINRVNAFSAEEMIRNIILAPGEAINVLICLNLEDTLCAYQAVIDYNKVGKVKIIGYDQSETILDGISKGIIEASLFVNTQEMGSLGMQALNQYDKEHKACTYYNIDVEMIRKDNVQQYMKSN